MQDVSQAINILLTGSVAMTFNTSEDQFGGRVRVGDVYSQRVEVFCEPGNGRCALCKDATDTRRRNNAAKAAAPIAQW